MTKDNELMMRKVDEESIVDSAQSADAGFVPKRAEELVKRMSVERMPVTVGNPSGYGMKLTDNEVVDAVKNYKAEEDEIYKSWKADCLD